MMFAVGLFTPTQSVVDVICDHTYEDRHKKSVKIHTMSPSFPCHDCSGSSGSRQHIYYTMICGNCQYPTKFFWKYTLTAQWQQCHFCFPISSYIIKSMCSAVQIAIQTKSTMPKIVHNYFCT